MAVIDVSRQRRSLLGDATALHHLPPNFLDIIRHQSSPSAPGLSLLDAVSEAALTPPLTERILLHFENLIPDLCARWLLRPGDNHRRLRITTAFARILPFAPHLSVFLRCPTAGAGTSRQHLQTNSALQLLLTKVDEEALASFSDDLLLQSLVSAWRLLNFDARTFRSLVSPSFIQNLFSHSSRPVRYVAIRIFCQLLHASDLKLEALIDQYISHNEALSADLDGEIVDYIFLSLHEHARVTRFLALRQQLRQNAGQPVDLGDPQTLTKYVASYGDVVLARPHGEALDETNLVMTKTTIHNLEQLATMLQNPDPILLYGQPGVGKTALVHEVAKQLGMYSSMVTLHLNEQTDAKMLVGLYATDSKPGTFQWRPGVLTTAVREGRWVLVEDLDRAPTEVLSTLLPLIERNELLVPSRGERIRAASSFRIFATVRTIRGLHGRENLPSFVGMRFWQSLYTDPLASLELEEVIVRTYPILQKFAAGILAVYSRLSQQGATSASLTRGRGTMDRQINLRDLMKWCTRLQECLTSAGSKTGEEPITETTRDWMFMEARDCFVGSCPDVTLANQLVTAIAEEMHLSKERAEHYTISYIPPLEETDLEFNIGRTKLLKRKLPVKLQRSKRPFASTAHAKKLLEQISVAVKHREPVLLVGETGIGKTTVVQQLAESLGHKLVAVNLSQQSEVGDLLGGFKPVNIRSLAVPLKEEFEDLFSATGISATKNQKYLEQVGKCFAKGQWSKVNKLWKEAPKMFSKSVAELEKRQLESNETENGDMRNGDAQLPKRRKTQSKLQTLLELKPRWDAFDEKLSQFDVQISDGSGAFAFSFVEGNLVKAVRNGHWVLLDEINLASPDTLESIADLLTGPTESPSLLLSETGEIEKIVAHPNFRIFGAMNPATDIGKRDLPIGIRSRFTELYVRSPDADLKDLLTIIKTYLGNGGSKNDQAADDIARLYLNTKRMAEEKRLVDGANEVPHFSLRTLTRVLSYVNVIAPLYGIRRALYEGFSMGFLTLLNRESEQMLVPLIHHHLLDRNGDSQSLLSQTPKHPTDGKRYVKFQNQNQDRQYWLFQGAEPVVLREDYIITPYVERNLLNLVRATSTRRFPILIQGPTSAGKTSMIEYLANFTGNKFVRINNHEHTDLQEYLGTYVSGPDGKLKFQEGILVQAMRKGHWIVLDELNLAPTDVLEALNRLLDDNRELLIPETQEVVRPHDNFILFATQNPPGLYGGRKVLSRAFRNRFLELHYDDIPEDELEFILQQRSRNTSPPDCRRIVSVYKELSRLRQTSRLFEQKDSFATLRDLFRWALREAETREDIAAHGFMLLAERVRNEDERVAVKDVIEKVFKLTIDPQKLYSADVAPELKYMARQGNNHGVVWTHAMRRLFVLVSRALRNNEPVLLVGETGCGKTTVCQLLAEAMNKQLFIVNAHQNTETGDLIGSQRPVRNRGAITEALEADLSIALEELELDTSGSVEEKLKRYRSVETESISPLLQDRIQVNERRSKALFEWSDGALVESMRGGQLFLLDEISLADDSVLERLNSVLEPQRTLLLAEKGIDNSFVVASEGFQFFATMNPGGDFGKKELSPALRNRFTEIWVSPLSESDDIYDIVQDKLNDQHKRFVNIVVQFAIWFTQTFRPMAATPFSIREILAWVQFINTFETKDPGDSIIHGASAIFIDSIGANPSTMLASDTKAIQQQRQDCLEKLQSLLERDSSIEYDAEPELVLDNNRLSIGHFSIPRDTSAAPDSAFAFHAPTTRLNAMRVIRALQMGKPILLEGSPGVGKTSLVVALSKACGRPLTRINLSDQTDLMDLFGTDVPVEGEAVGNFAWRDAPFLQAMQKGEWVLLDEMNLASQSVLEGLNACLDHRGEVYISELDQVFKCHPDFCLFAAQNPHHQGGGRKGLPASFVNRFVVVYADMFTDDDFKLIASHNFPNLSPDAVSHIIRFVSQIERCLVTEKSFGSQGGPWEFNLRDVLRWLHLLDSPDPQLRAARFDDFLNIIIRQRFRTQRDRDEVARIFTDTVGMQPRAHHLHHDINSKFGQVGLGFVPRNANSQPERLPVIDIVPRLPELESLIICVRQNIPCILSSASGYGKSKMLEYMAALSGKELVVFPMNADIDTMDLVGGFEQADPLREVNATIKDLREFLQHSAMVSVPAVVPHEALHLLHSLEAYSGNIEDIAVIRVLAEALLEVVTANSEVGERLSRALQLLNGPFNLSNPRFEWLDGVIVKALQTGQWLVLDNANMCNASVLDRLNSLLEPNGFLSINENCGPNGEPRIIVPHPEFRIFLTTDPRYGELSRAMRNRAIEIHLLAQPSALDRCFSKISTIESSLQRYHTSSVLFDTISSIGSTGRHDQMVLQNLSLKDMKLLPRFSKDSRKDSAARKHQFIAKEALEFLQSPTGSKFLEKVSDLYDGLCDGPASKSPDTQPIHPLNNEIVTRFLSHPGEAGWMATRYEILSHLHGINNRIIRHQDRARTSKLASLSRLQRSLISDRVAAVAKDSTVKLAAFFQSVNEAIQSYLRLPLLSSESWKPRSFLLKNVLCYMDRTLTLTADSGYDEATFQAHLAQGGDLFLNHAAVLNASEDVEFLKFLNQRLQDDFTLGFKLSTGLSMELLWNKLRPIPIPNKLTLERSLEIDTLAQRYDFLRWKANASVAELSKAQETLEEAYKIVRKCVTDSDQLVKELTIGIEALELQIGAEEIDLQPYFTQEFGTLRQLGILHSISGSPPTGVSLRELAVLSNVPTKSGLMMASSSETGALLQSLDALVYQEQYSWDGRFICSVWQKLQSLHSVGLESLALLEVEMPILAKSIARMSSNITSDPILQLNNLLWRIVLDVFTAEDVTLEQTAHTTYLRAAEQIEIDPPRQILAGNFSTNFVFKDLLEATKTTHLRQVTLDHFAPAIIAIASVKREEAHWRARFAALAWIHVSVGLIKLYVPDRVFDPQLRPMMHMQYFEELQKQLSDELFALRSLETSFTGQHSNIRTEVVEQQITDLGPPPSAITQIFRPERSDLGQLHAEFSNVLKTATSPSLVSWLETIDSSAANDENALQFIQENVRRLVGRLSSRFEAYQDMSRPVVSILRCLQVGLSLCDVSNPVGPDASTENMLRITPFFGATSMSIWDGSLTPPSMELLAYLAVMAAIEGVDNFLPAAREAVAESFHNFYTEWTQKLDADRKAEAVKGNLYRFRGSIEDEEEIDAQEFNELFPSYDDEQDHKPKAKPDQVRSISLLVAKAHKRLFLDEQDPLITLKNFTLSLGQRVNNDLNDQSAVDILLNEKMLSGTMLLLDQKLTALSSTSKDSSYNFYTDSNLSEVRQLVALANRIKSRFRELQLVDEIGHMQPLADVISHCDKLLELLHVESLAKILPKVEQLHTYVYEWEFGGWASRTYSVLSLHNSLTDTVIRWRRLELSTWANLFDMEQKKCQDDAYSWWFIAYQVVIATPLSMVDSTSELQSYAISLIQNLELYFTTSIVGQFSTRVTLLRQMQSHLRLLIQDYPKLFIILDSVTNFLEYFSRYEKAAESAIQTGRMPIEKKMKDVLLMASWKDTNINALRESARRSHQKLFRLVRKFRGILGKEMKSIIEQGLPDEAVKGDYLEKEPIVSVDLPEVHTSAVDRLLPGWLEEHRRLSKAQTTVSVMRRIIYSPEMSGSIAGTIDEFVVNLNESMAELRKETPPTLTDENKVQIKHLKTRKRRLFTETLRELKNMGLKYNLAQDKLSQQESLSAVLATITPLEMEECPSLNEASYYFHKTLDLLPKVRNAAREHSEDVSGGEVERSIGFVEGLINFTISQKNALATASRHFSAVKSSILRFNDLGKTQQLTNLTPRETDNQWPRFCPWLVNVARFAIHLVEVHAKLGDKDHGSAIQQLQSWAVRFEEHKTQYNALPDLPRKLSSQAHAQLELQLTNDLQAVRELIEQLIEERQELTFILKQLEAWTIVKTALHERRSTSLELLQFAQTVSSLCDTVLVAVQGAKRASAQLTHNPDTTGWLRGHNDAIGAMIGDLHMKSINKGITNCISAVEELNLNDPLASSAVMSLIGLASPILDNFATLCLQCISQSLDLHRATSHMAYNLTKAFAQIASQGFCSPQEKSDETSGDAGNLESGTGLGDGEGAEDISKDIQPDEDLSELAQEANKEKSDEIEDEKDAVDMADEELEGEMGSVDGADDDENGSQKGNEEEEENNMDEETGDVDDLDPTAVDEKMWDGDDEEADKDQQGDAPKGQQKDDDEQMANEDETKKDGPAEEQDPKQQDKKDTEAESEDEEEDAAEAKEELNRQDQNVPENDALDLPEDLEMDFDDQGSETSVEDDLDMESAAEEEDNKAQDENKLDDEDGDEEGKPATQKQLDQDPSEDEIDEEKDDAEKPAKQDEIQEEAEPEADPLVEDESNETEAQAPPPADNATADTENAAPSDVKSTGQDQSGESMELDQDFHANAAEQEDGNMGDAGADQDTSAGSKGATSQMREPKDKAEQDGDAEESANADPFKKLGDALEKWHRQQSDIQDAKREDDSNQKLEDSGEGEQTKKEFQHLQDDETAADTQAMGKADDDEAQPIDESMAIDEEKQDPNSKLMQEDTKDIENDAPDNMDVSDEPVENKDTETKSEKPDDRSGVKTRQGNYNREPTPIEEESGVVKEEKDDEYNIEETSTQLSTTHISNEERPLRDLVECMHQWTEYQTKSHVLSLSLTSQLRLILTPSQSTKLSGSFRTGKRLNIKRIIPYIASSYKRDKIWMRRSVPTKRTYQILLCVDDSKSMGESSSGSLAMESLVMVSRSLTMLEAGQVGIVGFGADVFTAHSLAEPFASDAGAKVLQRFSFSQDRTDIALLVRQTIDTFRAARQQSGGSADLWQLSLILSDGLTPSSAHDSIRRLLREAIEERIMIVFIIMDDTDKKRGDSVLELKEAKFINDSGENRVVIERYLDTFPFQYYLIVHNLEELPSALAGLLRTWFAEVTV